MDAIAAFWGFLIAVLLVLFEMSVIYPLPLSDIGSVRYRTMPTMTYLLIIANGLIFIAWQAPDYYRAVEIADLQPYVDKLWTYGYRDVFMTQGQSIGAFTTFTSMFMHADIWHLFGNMIFLWTFGRRLEDSCGPWRYLLFYLTAGMIANIGSEVLNPAQSDLPSVGASGAIAGLMGAFLVLFPRARIQCMWFLGMILWLPYRIITRGECVFAVCRAARVDFSHLFRVSRTAAVDSDDHAGQRRWRREQSGAPAWLRRRTADRVVCAQRPARPLCPAPCCLTTFGNYSNMSSIDMSMDDIL